MIVVGAWAPTVRVGVRHYIRPIGVSVPLLLGPLVVLGGARETNEAMTVTGRATPSRRAPSAWPVTVGGKPDRFNHPFSGGVGVKNKVYR
jgi:hypothetical protein